MLTYDALDNKEEWQKYYHFAMKGKLPLLVFLFTAHALISSEKEINPESNSSNNIGDVMPVNHHTKILGEYNSWMERRENKKAGLLWKNFDVDSNEISFSINKSLFKLKCPSLAECTFLTILPDEIGL